MRELEISLQALFFTHIPPVSICSHAHATKATTQKSTQVGRGLESPRKNESIDQE
jgi:hypothetical protein